MMPGFGGMFLAEDGVPTVYVTADRASLYRKAFGGTIRVKHGNGDWHTHDFSVEACDNGEPGVGRDTFSITVSGTGPGHGSTGRTVLTGGNIQAH